MNGEKNFAVRAWELLREGPFRRYIIGSAISDTGTWMQVMAQGWVMSALTNHALMLGMVNFAAGIPLSCSPIGGSVPDRHDMRLILIAGQIVQIELRGQFLRRLQRLLRLLGKFVRSHKTYVGIAALLATAPNYSATAPFWPQSPAQSMC